jgi:pimeloyl-ACP methyl ester carboxylesterase
MYTTGNRKGHYRAFINLLRNAESWQAATRDNSRIRVPVLFVWGDQDWARADEKAHDLQLVPGAKMIVVEHGGHFLPLDKPDELIEHLCDFAGRHAA